MSKEITVRKVYDFLSDFAPAHLAESWDNVGLQVGCCDERVEGILVSLDAIEPVLWEAVEQHCNLVITHHPVFLNPILRLDDTNPSSRIARLATQIDLNILTFHTNLDSTAKGLNDLLAKKLGLNHITPLIPDSKDPSSHGMGRVGTIPKTTLRDYLEILAQQLEMKNFRFLGDPMQPIRKVAVVTGSGGSFFKKAKDAGADVLITGDVKYHQALDSLSEGIALIDIGHFTSEIGMVELIAQQLKAWLKAQKSKIKVFETQAQRDPFQFWQI